MRKVLTIVAVIVLFIPFFEGNEKASASKTVSTSASVNLIESLQIESFKRHVLEDLKDEYPNAQFLDISTEENKQLQKDQKVLAESDFGLTAAAPPLTYLQVYAAISSNYPEYEYFSENQLSSVQDHGGAELYIVTAELGYGHIEVAKLNGKTLKELQRQYIDLDGDTIVDGWYIWWDASGNENGTFTYQNTSTNSPWNTMSDSMYIK